MLIRIYSACKVAVSKPNTETGPDIVIIMVMAAECAENGMVLKHGIEHSRIDLRTANSFISLTDRFHLSLTSDWVYSGN